MAAGRIRVNVIPLGDAPPVAAKVVAAHLREYFGLDSEVAPAQPHPSYAHDPVRDQYNAGLIVARMEEAVAAGPHKALGVFGGDLFVPILSHVFGEARLGGACGLVSLYRLQRNQDGSPAQHAVWLERAAKVALHEIGHVLGLPHCQDERCLMRFCSTMEELDRQPLALCRYCAVFLRDALEKDRG
jgi:archaemetzincin